MGWLSFYIVSRFKGYIYFETFDNYLADNQARNFLDKCDTMMRMQRKTKTETKTKKKQKKERISTINDKKKNENDIYKYENKHTCS